MGSGNEQSGWRPGVVFQNNVGNAHSPNVIALPLTSSIKKTNQPTHVVVLAADTGLLRDSMVLCENPEKMSKARIGKFLTRLPDEYMKKIAAANLLGLVTMTKFKTRELPVRNIRSAVRMCRTLPGFCQRVHIYIFFKLVV